MVDVLIPVDLLARLRRSYELTKSTGEAGGILLGYRKSRALQMIKETYPMPWDRATATSFKRSARGHRVAALREWKRTNSTADWIGEWHTHPFGAASPSFTDQRTWRAIASETKKEMAFVIVGAGKIFVGLQVEAGNVRALYEQERDDEFILFSE